MNNNENPPYVDETIRELCHLLKMADNEDFTYEFFSNLFTKPELKDFANRWLLVKEIDKGTTQREIADVLICLCAKLPAVQRCCMILTVLL